MTNLGEAQIKGVEDPYAEEDVHEEAIPEDLIEPLHDL